MVLRHAAASQAPLGWRRAVWAASGRLPLVGCPRAWRPLRDLAPTYRARAALVCWYTLPRPWPRLSLASEAALAELLPAFARMTPEDAEHLGLAMAACCPQPATPDGDGDGAVAVLAALAALPAAHRQRMAQAMVDAAIPAAWWGVPAANAAVASLIPQLAPALPSRCWPDAWVLLAGTRPQREADGHFAEVGRLMVALEAVQWRLAMVELRRLCGDLRPVSLAFVRDACAILLDLPPQRWPNVCAHATRAPQGADPKDANARLGRLRAAARPPRSPGSGSTSAYVSPFAAHAAGATGST